ncbi:MAG TPA: nuclear transport factor 2 family protein [Gammaproteobacteria bacterium]|nr:nuclear transport factor 2 family protein [Gammaproteobacteria bacterium]HRP86394.1 nuclear transport factor 2 family protein [Gammaproteobacteria bacterium]
MSAAMLADGGAPSRLVARFQQTFQELRHDNLSRLAAVYADDVLFEDPLHRVEGLAALTEYFERMYAGVESISFEFGEVIDAPGQAMLTWTMRMTHRRLRPGEPLALPGASHIRYDQRVHYHRDYFDAGALLYERLPLLGTVVRAVRRRV